MKLIIAGLGPGSPDLITRKALNEASSSDMIIVPRSHGDSQGLAEKILLENLPASTLRHFTIPMTYNEKLRDRVILEQLEASRPHWQHAQKVFFPVIGDSMLYSSGAYLLDVWRKILPDIEAEFVPGVSAHSLAASCAEKFLAMRGEIFSVIPGTADPEKVRNALASCDTAAIYKPTALKNLPELVKDFAHIIRVDFAGIPERERIFEGEDALHNINEYLSVILLWKNS